MCLCIIHIYIDFYSYVTFSSNSSYVSYQAYIKVTRQYFVSYQAYMKGTRQYFVSYRLHEGNQAILCQLPGLHE